MGIPYGLLNSVARTYSLARCAYDVYRRQRLARDLLRDSPWSGFIPKDRGYARVQTNTLPGIDAEEGARLLKGRHENVRKSKRTHTYVRLRSSFLPNVAAGRLLPAVTRPGASPMALMARGRD